MRIQIPLLLLGCVPVLAGDSKNPAPTSGGDWEFSLSAGPAVRTLGQVKINSGYRSGGFTLPSLVGSDSLTVPPIGDTTGYADREYNDGYVRQDAGTGTDGTTWHWGYDSASQVQGEQLVFQATGFQSIRGDLSNAPNSGPASKDTLDGIAPHIQFDVRSPHYIGPFRVGFSAGMDFIKTDQSLAFSNFSATQTREDYRLDYVDRYDLQGVIPPQAPYAGSYAGPGPLIDNIPAIRNITPVLIFTDTATFANQVHSSINIDAFSFTMGPTFSLRKGPLEFAFSGGVIVNVYDWSARQSETLDGTSSTGVTRIAQWQEHDSGVKVRPGFYAQTDVTYALNEQLGFGGFLRLDAASEFRAQAGPTIYKIDPYGVTAGLQLRWMLD
ncbi:hypothetical protein OKA04_19395 [Luteolibacter flavescens]|uniref:Uncharacterized protein n=1 Tax=Luteolibacter flavescens TaxID=1859460 RepID=A0ABT3FTK6_9BACT|nr:hypothetical protein [Luteolibacter flavescens]MCW1886914.1 hypothetical protein [Luteolibacter flavescens]